LSYGRKRKKMAVREILLLGNENLYRMSKEISKEEIYTANALPELYHIR
jgi:hypothetical protein